ncbi:MAG: NAD(P)H-quinone oxidoreductase [Acidobacteria bacterium]|nr:NAD(P)H-quinone oxidoreductase [Acidobacteriota bacterium]
MQAIQVRDGALVWEAAADPVPMGDEVSILVHAAGVNRADLLQARGLYPPPAGASPILGLELAGTVEGTGERVCALVPGGAYASRAAVHRDMLLPVPENWSFAQGAAVPEAWLTAFVNLFLEGDLREGEAVLIHAGASGVGTAAIQLARAAGARAYVTVRTESKAQACRDLGAEVVAMDALPPVNVILDCVGASYLPQNIAALAPFGRLVNIGLLGGAKGELDLNAVLRKRLKIVGSTLRSRPRSEHIQIVRAFRERFWEQLTGGAFQIVVDRQFPIEQAGEAHRYMAENRNLGKIVLVVE